MQKTNKSSHRKFKFKRIFITVGTTEFDNLIKIVNTEDFTRVLKAIGCRELTIQYGSGSNFKSEYLDKSEISVKTYRLRPDIVDDISRAHLVISHAGAGTCTEVLYHSKPLVVVVNEELMGNHQVELAEQLHKDGHLFYCTPESLGATLLESDFHKLRPYKKGDMTKFIKELDLLMGFNPKRK